MFNADNLFDPKLTEGIKHRLIHHHETLSVAESVTSGLIQAAFGTTPEASRFYQGGITAYNLGQKYRHLLIEPIHAMQCDCVSSKVAGDMALHVCEMFSSHWGLGITGYAVPTEESGNKLYAHCAIAYKGQLIFEDKVIPRQEHPFHVQLEYVDFLLNSLSTYLIRHHEL